MPIATNRERLPRGLTPGGMPWQGGTTREVCDVLGVTLQSAYNWQVRRSGPPRTMSRSRRASYRWGDVWHWLEGEGSATADQRIRTFLEAHIRLAMCATGLMRGEAGAGVRRALARLGELSGEELEIVCMELDRVGVPWPKAVSVGEDREHG